MTSLPLDINDSSSEQQLQLAAKALSCFGLKVVFRNTIVMYATPNVIVCEVIDSMPNTHRCVEEYKVLAENAKRSLADSNLARYLPGKPLQWRVIEISPKGSKELWPEPYI